MPDIIGFERIGPDKPDKENKLAKISPEDLLIEIGRIVFSEPNEYNYLLEEDPKSYISTDTCGFEELYKVKDGFELEAFIKANKDAIKEVPELKEKLISKIKFLLSVTPPESTEYTRIKLFYEIFNP